MRGVGRLLRPYPHPSRSVAVPPSPWEGEGFGFRAPVCISPRKPPQSRAVSYLLYGGYPLLFGVAYFFWTYFRQSSMTATRMMMPEKMNCRLASMPSTVRE